MGYGKDDELAINTIRLLAVGDPTMGFLSPAEKAIARREDLLKAQLLTGKWLEGRCNLQGKFGAPWRPNGHGPGCSCSVQQVHELQSFKP